MAFKINKVCLFAPLLLPYIFSKAECVVSFVSDPSIIMTMPATVSPTPDRSFLMDELDDHLDPDLDEDLRRLSFETMNSLQSIADEVDAMERKVDSASKLQRQRSRSNQSSPQAGGVGGGEKEEVGNNSSEQHLISPAGTSSLKHIDDMDIPGEEDEMSFDGSLDGMSLDGSIARELDALRTVAKEIEKELQFEDDDSMLEAINKITQDAAAATTADDVQKRILTSDDHKIIQRALLDEMKNYEPKNSWERFMKRYHLEGLSDQDKTYALTALCTVIWSMVLSLVYQVKYGEML